MTKLSYFGLKYFFMLLYTLIMFNAVVIPNAQQELLFTSLLFVATISLYKIRIKPISFILMITTFIVTLFYITLGLIRGATSEAVVQTLFIYIFSPVLWLLVINYFWNKYGLDFIIRSLAIYTIIACSTVPIYIYLFLTQGPGSVAFFGGIPNVNITESYSGVTMHVAGSFLFLIPAFVSGYGVLKSRYFSIIVILALLISALFTGRTMALISFFVGFIFYLINFISNEKLKNIFSFTTICLILTAVVITIFSQFEINIIQLLSIHFDKVMGGDKARPEQALALIEGAENNFFLGAGHGLGVNYLRSDEFPWRYEAVYFALLFKVGLIGLLIVILPFITCILYFMALVFLRRANKYDRFFGASVLVVFLAGFTNPYPEAFSFQWMYFMPIYYFYRTYFFKSKEIIKT